MSDQRGQLLRAALGFAGCSMLSYDRALHAMRSWLPYEPGTTRRWLMKQPGWPVAEVQWQRRISAGA